MKEINYENFIMEENISEDTCEKWLPFILMFNIVLSENESLWEKYQATDNNRADFLSQQLAENESSFILEKNTQLYRARAINFESHSNIVMYKDIKKCLIKLKKELEKIGKMPLTINDTDLLTLFLLSPSENAKIELIRKEMLSIQTKNFKGYEAEGCSCPTASHIKAGRLNTKSDEFLYLAFTKETCVKEMRPAMHHEYSIATGSTKRDLRICDLTQKSISKVLKKKNLTDNTWLARKVSEPNCIDDEKFYAITQELSNIIKNKGYDGIKFDSAMDNKGINIMLFDKNNVEFISSEVVQINEINISFTMG